MSQLICYHGNLTGSLKLDGKWYFIHGCHNFSNFGIWLQSIAAILACGIVLFILCIVSASTNIGDFHALAIVCFATVSNWTKSLNWENVNHSGFKFSKAVIGSAVIGSGCINFLNILEAIMKISFQNIWAIGHIHHCVGACLNLGIL